MTLQVEIKFSRVYHIGIHDSASWTVPAPVCDVGCWEKTNVVAFSNNNDGDCWANSGFLAGL